jgi:hypothetical protein
VLLKVVRPSLHPHEAEISAFVSSKDLASDPRNHCVPLYEVLTVPDEEDKILLVFPLLRDWDKPKFETVGEGVEFFRQIFEVRANKLDSNILLITRRGFNSCTSTI